ncbi:MAG: hypothetical protein LBS35_11170 [Synergistaceae bacterium]|jgi:hypothetical protein|nr:hypothetical protein [Synergistaceae bacterium]
MEPTPYYLKKRNKKAGFSLIVVLIISLVGLAIVGVTLQLTVNSGGSGRVAGASSARYNLLQEAVEEGRARLMEIMDNADSIPRYANAHAESGSEQPIDELSDLLIDVEFDSDLLPGVVRQGPIQLGRLGIMDTAGGVGQLTVSIYDMQYDTDLIDSSLPLGLLPPRVMLDNIVWRKDGDTLLAEQKDESFEVPNKGMYLIRGELSVGGRVTILDSAVLQANNVM